MTGRGEERDGGQQREGGQEERKGEVQWVEEGRGKGGQRKRRAAQSK
jgi:hypothetical protein